MNASRELQDASKALMAWFVSQGIDNLTAVAIMGGTTAHILARVVKDVKRDEVFEDYIRTLRLSFKDTCK